ncbi:Amino acid transporter [Cryptosporangium aurantiacum]|uniref:Amino acid transporter n=2 Tax=Cryptosporangium aurantiacum TaxID=134849 RepID=A0A1M7PE78_9ACTN|nr:Amino acid transporter [Cryptosporangium aurantiacum]
MQLTLLLVMTHSPLLLIWAAVSSIYQIGGVVATPLVLLLAGALLFVFSIGYGGIARRVRYQGGFYAFVRRGLGGPAALVVATVAMAAYLLQLAVLQVYFATALSALVDMTFEVQAPGAIGVAIVVCCALGLGLLRFGTMMRFLLGLAALQVVALLWLTFTALSRPADGALSGAGLNPSWLLTGSFGLALCMALTAFVGSETGAFYAGEVDRPERTIPLATSLGYVVTTGVLVVSAWALSVAAGPESIVYLARSFADPRITEAVPLAVPVIGGLVDANQLEGAMRSLLVVLVLGTLASVSALNGGASRLLSAIADNGHLPHRFAGRNGVPTVARLVGPLVGGVIALAVVARDDRGITLVLAVTAGVCMLAVLATTSLATTNWFLRRDDEETGFFGWEGHVTAAGVTAVAMTCVLLFASSRLPGALSPYSRTLPTWFPFAYLIATALGGLLWGMTVRHRKYSSDG